MTTFEIDLMLYVDSDGLHVKKFHGSDDGPTEVVQTRKELQNAIRRFAENDGGANPTDEISVSFVCSSTVDFPRESNGSETVIELCEAIRGGLL